MIRLATIVAIASAVLWGCSAAPRPGSSPSERQPGLGSVAASQAEVYGETVTGLFVSLADFEDSPGGARGFQQVDWFSIEPPSPDGERKFAVNVTRTGAGAMAVTLPKGSHLLFTIPACRDFTGYKLLSLALYSQAVRDDLCVTLTTERGAWTSHRTLVTPGWNTVLIDIQRLIALPEFDIAGVKGIDLSFCDAAGPVSFHLDDILLTDNDRLVDSAPPGMTLRKSGLDYSIALPGRPQPIVLSQGDDGLWRLGEDQPLIQLVPPGEPLPPEGERLELMGTRSIGSVELLEANPVRVRLANTWYYPTRAGEWMSLGMRRIRWEYTFYADGRWVTCVEINNSGGQPIDAVRLWLAREAAWSQGAVSRDLVARDFKGPVGRWSFLQTEGASKVSAAAENYLEPGSIQTVLAADGVFAEGDLDRDGFDESQGCYYLMARNGHCRFTVSPPSAGLQDPVFRIGGGWSGPVQVSSQGMALRDVVTLRDGSVLFRIPGRVERPLLVEVVGEVSSTSD